MEPITIGIIGMVVFLFLILLGLPIAFTAFLVGFVGVYVLSGFETMTSFAGYMPFAVTFHYNWGVLPLFLLMGYFSYHAGITRALYDTAGKWVGHFPGGLAIATVFGGAGFAAASGSSLASAAIFGRVAVPEMLRAGYDPKLATGSVAASGTLAVMIPPSIILVIYGLLAQQSIAVLLIAGFIPGMLEAISYATMILVRCARKPSLGAAQPAVSWKQRFLSLKGTWGILVLVVLIIGGMFVGLFTPTEAGAVGAMGALLIALFTRKLTWATFKSSLLDTTRLCAMLFLIIAGMLIFMRFLALSGLTVAITDLIMGLPVGPTGTLVVVLLVGTVYGFFLSPIGVLMLIVPIFAPIMVTLGINPVVFGILVVRVTEIAMIIPPIGVCVYAVKSVVPDVPIEDIFKGALPFLIVDFINLAMLIAIPQIILFLPGLMP